MTPPLTRDEIRAASRPLATELGLLPVVIDGNRVSVPSDTIAGHNYTVLIGPDGMVCTCGDFENRDRDCKHIDRVRREMTTEQTQALVPIKLTPPVTALPSRSELAVMDYVAGMLIESKGVSIPANLKTKEDVRAVILAGWEFGVKPMSALRNFFVIDGQVHPMAQIMAGIVESREAGARFLIVRETKDETTMRFIRPSKGVDVEFTYSMEDAKIGGLSTKTNWAKFPKDMRRWACIKRLCRVYAPDLINSISGGADFEGVSLADGPEPRIIDVGSLPMSELYNEGDDERSVDIETGEISDGPLAQDHALRVEYKALMQDLKESWEPRAYRSVYTHVVNEWGLPDHGLLTEQKARDAIAYVRNRRGEPPPEPVAVAAQIEPDDLPWEHFE